MNLFEGLSASKSDRPARVTYSLNEIITVLFMIVQKKALDEISKLTGRSLHTLRYKFCENQIVLNKKRQIRSVKKYLYKDHTQVDLVEVPFEDALKALFADFKEEYKGDEDIKARIKAYMDERNGTTPAVVEPAVDEVVNEEQAS